jgi:hypothetical protein
MDMADEEAVEKGFADLSRVDHWLISAGTILNSAIVNYDGSGPFWMPIVSSPSKVYTACRQSDVFRYGSNGQA